MAQLQRSKALVLYAVLQATCSPPQQTVERSARPSQTLLSYCPANTGSGSVLVSLQQMYITYKVFIPDVLKYALNGPGLNVQ